MPSLYIVATPIGNLEDLTLRAIRVLREVDLIAAEDTRTTQRLLAALGIDNRPRLIALHDHNEKDRAHDLVELARDAGVTVATGHISAEESVALARKAKEVGLEKFIFTHPIINIVEASEAQLKEVADLGYIIEFTWISAFPMWQGLDPKAIAAAARSVGANRCIMTTDAQNDFNPTAPEMLRMFIATMLQLGVDKEDIDWMVKRNPAKLAGLED